MHALPSGVADRPGGTVFTFSGVHQFLLSVSSHEGVTSHNIVTDFRLKQSQAPRCTDCGDTGTSTLSPVGGHSSQSPRVSPCWLGGELSAGCREGRIFAQLLMVGVPTPSPEVPAADRIALRIPRAAGLPGFNCASGTWDKAAGSALLKAGSPRSIKGTTSVLWKVWSRKTAMSSSKLLFGATVTLQRSGLFEQRENLIS